MSASRGFLERMLGRGLVFVDQALVSGSNFVTTVMLVRSLGLAGFGRFSLLAMGVVFAQSLQQACLGTPMLTIGPKESARNGPGYYAGALRLELVFLACVLVLGALAAPFLVRAGGIEAGARETWAALGLALARCAHDFVRQQAFARERLRAVLAFDLLAYGGQLLVIGVLVLCQRLSVFSALSASAAASAAGALLGITLQGVFRAARGTTRAVLVRHLPMSRWLVALAFLQWCTTNAFALAAGAVLGPAALGTVKAGQTALGFLHVLLLALENVVPVRAAGLAARGAWTELLRYQRRVALLGGACTLLVAGLVASMPGVLARLFYGSSSADQELVIRGFALLYVFAFAISVLSIRLRTRESTRPIFMAQALAAAAALAAARPTVEVFGLAGAVAGMVLQQALIACALLLAVRQVARANAIEVASVLSDASAP